MPDFRPKTTKKCLNKQTYANAKSAPHPTLFCFLTLLNNRMIIQNIFKNNLHQKNTQKWVFF